MRDTIAILDDEPARLFEMKEVLAREVPKYRVATCADAPEMIAYLEAYWECVVLVSLDHDLIPLTDDQPDPGTGRDVAEYVAMRTPCCPVIIHSTNWQAAEGMQLVMRDTGWSCSRISPYDDLTWIGELWIEEVIAKLQFSK